MTIQIHLEINPEEFQLTRHSTVINSVIMKIPEVSIFHCSSGRKWVLLVLLILLIRTANAAFILIPMDEKQANHLKAYGITYWTLEQGMEIKWLLNYRGGSFLIQQQQAVSSECTIRGVSYEILADGLANNLLADISREDVNQDAVSMQKAPKIAVYSPPINKRRIRLKFYRKKIMKALVFPGQGSQSR